MEAKIAERDHVDRWLETVDLSSIPNLDLEVEGIVDRIMGLQRRFKRSMEETLAEHGLSHGEWKVLGALFRAGEPYQRSAGKLADVCECSSGAMTNRLDRLETEGLVRRLPDPDDRRGVLVELTAKGHEVWNESTGAQARKEALVAGALNKREKKQLNSLLRGLMLEFERLERED
ncbi:MAG TPA: MarR family transcriptional regulator [Gaiellaceae bacterium]|nr:MarR family transcriptional regulator [Gaiellaceae bacterium]